MSFFEKIVQATGPLLPTSFGEKMARDYFNQRFAYIGTITSLKIDSANHQITADLELKGETQSLHLDVKKYELTSADGKTWLEIKELHTSREWINALGQELLKGKKIEVPNLVKAIL